MLGLIALPLAFIPVAGWFLAPPVAFTGIGVGLGNLGRLKAGKADNRAQTWIGVGLSVGALIVNIVYLVVVIVSLGAASSAGQ